MMSEHDAYCNCWECKSGRSGVDTNVHTPGPWITETNAHGEPRVYTPGVDGNGDADWTGWIDLAGEAATDANAHLIAAAPDLLAALRAVVDQSESIDNPDDWDGPVLHAVTDDAMANVLAAIAKALGSEVQA